MTTVDDNATTQDEAARIVAGLRAEDIDHLAAVSDDDAALYACRGRIGDEHFVIVGSRAAIAGLTATLAASEMWGDGQGVGS